MPTTGWLHVGAGAAVSKAWVKNPHARLLESGQLPHALTILPLYKGGVGLGKGEGALSHLGEVLRRWGEKGM